ncbi:MAG: glycoside hydrolase family 95-like protein [Candidatus Ornithomonoglobus sp.]
MDDDAASTERGDKYVKHISNGDRAYSIYQGQVKDALYDNMFDFHTGSDDSPEEGIFQIDGNFGSTAAMGEFLMQSHDGYIDILPSLPTAWAESGSVTGLLARGGFETDIAWQKAKPVNVKIRSKAGNKCRIYINEAFGEISIDSAEGTLNTKTVSEDGLNILEFDTKIGEEYSVRFTR